MTRERLAHRLDQAVDAHLNLVRIWGGGIYESEDFYELCDELGLLVWQDFLLACAAYPEEQPIWDELEAEAREHVARLTPHPSLVLWNGGNENVWGYLDWGWQAELEGRTWGLPVRHGAPARGSSPSSTPPAPTPTAARSPPAPHLTEIHPNDPDHGTHHQWEVWNRVDYTVYGDEVPRFCSEFGFQGAADVGDADPGGARGRRRTADQGRPGVPAPPEGRRRQRQARRGLDPHLRVPDDFADWHWATQLNQARAVAVRHRALPVVGPRTAGAIVWQLNDCWPVTSWAAIDGDERPKPLWYALKAAYAPRLLTVQPREGREVLAVVNDTSVLWQGTVHLSRQRLDGTVLAEEDQTLAVGAWSVGQFRLPTTVATPDDPAREILVVRLGDLQAVHPWAEDIDLDLDPAPLRASATPVQDGYRVDVTATSLARDVTLLVDRLDPDAHVDVALVDIPAGSTASFHVRTRGTFDPAELTRAPVLRSANDVVIPRLREPDARDLSESPA